MRERTLKATPGLRFCGAPGVPATTGDDAGPDARHSRWPWYSPNLEPFPVRLESRDWMCASLLCYDVARYLLGGVRIEDDDLLRGAGQEAFASTEIERVGHVPHRRVGELVRFQEAAEDLGIRVLALEICRRALADPDHIEVGE